MKKIGEDKNNPGVRKLFGKRNDRTAPQKIKKTPPPKIKEDIENEEPELIPELYQNSAVEKVITNIKKKNKKYSRRKNYGKGNWNEETDMETDN